jgi:hypothetical protein
VDREHDGCFRGHDRVDDCSDVVRHGDLRSIGVDRLETGQRQRGDLVAVGAQQRGDLIPRPGPEPEPGHEDDRCGRHVPDLAESG